MQFCNNSNNKSSQRHTCSLTFYRPHHCWCLDLKIQDQRFGQEDMWNCIIHVRLCLDGQGLSIRLHAIVLLHQLGWLATCHSACLQILIQSSICWWVSLDYHSKELIAKSNKQGLIRSQFKFELPPYMMQNQNWMTFCAGLGTRIWRTMEHDLRITSLLSTCVVSTRIWWRWTR